MVYPSNSAKGTILTNTFLLTVGNIATRYRIHGQGIETLLGARLSIHVQTSPRAKPRHLYHKNSVAFTRVKGPGYVALSNLPIQPPRLKKQ